MSITTEEKQQIIVRTCRNVVNPKRDWVRDTQVHLVDVLVALWEKKGQKGFLKAADLIFPGSSEHWELYDDRIDAQFPQTIDFIFNLICVL